MKRMYALGSYCTMEVHEEEVWGAVNLHLELEFLEEDTSFRPGAFGSYCTVAGYEKNLLKVNF